MSLKPSQRLFSLLIIPILLTMIGCGGTSGGTAVVIPPAVGGLLTDGGFEFGSDAWSGNATNFQPEEGNETNTVNFADIAVAGQSFDVNLSQVLPITQGKRYSLSFRARTNAVAAAPTAETRTILAGIGLNEAPFTNTTKEVTLTTEWQTFTLTLDASSFGIENSRVLFDMGADTGVVVLDDVVLTEVGDIPPPPISPNGGLVNGDFEDGTTAWTGNAANVTDELLGFDGSLANFANVEVAGQSFDVNLSQVLTIIQGETYTLTFKAKSDGERTIIAGIGLNEDPFTSATETVNLTADWQTYTLTLSAADFGSTNSRVLFDMGADTGVVIIDDVVIEGDFGTSAGGELITNGGFENGTTAWSGNAANVTDELLGFDGSLANFANIETAGDAFAVNLSQVVPITQGETYTLTFRAKSDRNRSILAGIGLNEDPFTNNSESVDLTTEWQSFTLTLPATDFGSANSRVLFDMGAEIGQVIIDDVSLMLVGGIDTGIFDDGLLTNGDFENGANSWTGNAASVSEELLGFNESKANFANIETAGDAFNVNLSQVVSITQGETYTLTFKAKSDGARSIIAGIGLNEAPFTNNTQTVDLTTDWRTFTLTLPATDFGGANSRVLFDMGAETGVVIIDEVSLVGAAVVTPPTPPAGPFDDGLLTNGDFEAGVSPWIGNAANVTDELLGFGGTLANFASVDAAGQPFDVNLSQVVAITQGSTYTLTFKAKSDGSRTMLAGIGLNEAPFSNNSQAVNLTTEWQTFTLTLPATDFGGANSRVLFDMGADTGQVIIDEVSLIQGDGTPPPVGTLECDSGVFDAGLLANGDFENGVASWVGNAANVTTELLGCNASAANFANVEVAGQSFDVNLSQVIAITQGESYTLTFKAKSDGVRSLIAGIGLNEAPFSNDTETVTLAAGWQTFTLTFPSASFGGANSRVLFDMGADTGQVIIDEVSLVGPGDVVVTPPTTPTGDNLAINGDFETGDLSGWELFPGVGTIEVSTTQNNGGSFSGRLLAGEAQDVIFKQANLAVGSISPGATITVSFDMYGSVAGAGGVVFAELFSELSGGGTSKAEILSGGPIFPDGTWTPYSFTTTVGSDVSGGVTLQLKASCGAVTGCGVDAFFDNVSIVSGSVTPPTPPTTPTGDDLAINGDFETGDLSGWELFPGVGTIEVSTDQNNGGSFSGRLLAAESQDVIFKQANLAVGTISPGDTITVSFDMYGSLSGAGGVVFAEFFSELSGGGTSKAEIFTGAPLAPTSTWTNYSFTTTAGSDVSGGVTLQLKASCGAVAGCGVDAYFDNVSIQTGSGAGGGDTGGGDTGGGDTGGGTPEPSVGDLTTNGNFELGNLSGWTVNDEVNITADGSQSSGSTWSGHLVAAPGTGKALSQAGLAVGIVSPGDTIDVSFDMCATTADGGIIFPALLSEFGGGTGAFRENLAVIDNPASVWTRYNYSTTAGSNVDGGITLQLDAVCGANAGCIADVYFDNVSVTIGGGVVAGNASGESCDVSAPPPPPPPPPAATEGVLSVFADAAATGWAPWNDAGATWVVVVDDPAYGNVVEFSTAGQTVVGFSTRTDLGGSGVPHDASGIVDGTVEFDIKMTAAPATSVWRLKLEGTGGVEVQLSCAPALDTWVHCSTPLSAFGDLTALNNVMIFPDWAANAGAVYRVDNVELVMGDGTPPPPPPTGNATLLNGDFENGLTSWTQNPDASGALTPGTITHVTSAPGGRAGSVARLEAEGSAAGAQDVLLTQIVGAGTINAGDIINASFDLYGSLAGAGGVVFVELIYLDSAGNDNGRNFLGAAAPYAPNATWTTHNGSKPAGTRADGTIASVEGGVMILLKASCGAIVNGCGVDAYFDNVTFTVN